MATPGPHAGKGPKGYERSDDDIRKEINHRLAQNGQLDASGIYVSVIDCEVTLTGTVNSRQAKRLAEDIADSVFGVRDVHNELGLQKTSPADQNLGANQTKKVVAQVWDGGGNGKTE